MNKIKVPNCAKLLGTFIFPDEHFHIAYQKAS